MRGVVANVGRTIGYGLLGALATVPAWADMPPPPLSLISDGRSTILILIVVGLAVVGVVLFFRRRRRRATPGNRSARDRKSR
jgi:MYXO-CTERM domain-containing protein